MSKVRHVKELILLSVFLIASFGVGVVSFISSNRQAKNTTSTFASSNKLADVSLESYCKDGYYKIPGEPDKCSRAPGCGGSSYDSLNTKSKMPNPQSCTTNPNACGGAPPLCCYEMARTGDYTKCIGYWERLWCPQQLCDEAKQNGASDSQCDGNCQCSHAFGHYCGSNVQIMSASQRLGLASAPATSTPIPPTQIPTSTPIPTKVLSQNTPPTIAIATPTTIPTQVMEESHPSPPLQQPSPTTADTFVFDFQNNNESGNINDAPNTQAQQNNNLSNRPPSQNNEKQDQNTNSNSNSSIAFSPPQIEIKTPKEVLRETFNPTTVEKLNTTTAKPLAVAKTSFVTIKSYDQKLENTVENWVFKARISIMKFFQ